MLRCRFDVHVSRQPPASAGRLSGAQSGRSASCPDDHRAREHHDASSLALHTANGAACGELAEAASVRFSYADILVLVDSLVAVRFARVLTS